MVRLWWADVSHSNAIDLLAGRLTMVEPEELDPRLLVGRRVVEVGLRQAWPFLTIADRVTGREVRVYVDAFLMGSPWWIGVQVTGP